MKETLIANREIGNFNNQYVFNKSLNSLEIRSQHKNKNEKNKDSIQKTYYLIMEKIKDSSYESKKRIWKRDSFKLLHLKQEASCGKNSCF